ncbi:MAG: hypothetical protein K2P14_05340 [Anaeroplasmataceae bacterium]|nr:hypothetical protein [Anaeroplasmataceae bacterium]
MLVFVFIILLLFCLKYNGIARRYSSEIVGLSIVLTLALITALSSTVSARSSVLLDISLPGFVEKYWGHSGLQEG